MFLWTSVSLPQIEEAVPRGGKNTLRRREGGFFAGVKEQVTTGGKLVSHKFHLQVP